MGLPDPSCYFLSNCIEIKQILTQTQHSKYGLNGMKEKKCNIRTIYIEYPDFDYKQYPVGHFDIVHASPPCIYYSKLQYSWIGRMKKILYVIILIISTLWIDTILIPFVMKWWYL